MGIPNDVPPVVPFFPIEEYFPYASPDASVFGSNIPGQDARLVNHFPLRPGASPTISMGSTGGTGADETFQRRGGLIGAGIRTTSASVGRWWAHPLLSQIPCNGGELAAGWENEEWQRVCWWRMYWHIDGGAGPILQTDNTGWFMAAAIGSPYNAAHVPTGATPRSICGLVGRDDGGTQGLRWRAWDGAGAVLETIDLPRFVVGDWNIIDVVLQAAAPGREARVFVWVNDPGALAPPTVDRPMDGVNLLRPEDFGPTIWGIGWGIFFLAADPAARWITYRWRLRGGKFLPDGQEVRS